MKKVRYICRKFSNDLISKYSLQKKYWVETTHNSEYGDGLDCFEKIKNGKSTLKGRFIAHYSAIYVIK